MLSTFLFKLLFFAFTANSFIINNKQQRHGRIVRNLLPSNIIQDVAKQGGALGEPFSFTEFIKNVEAQNIRDVTIIKNTNNLFAVDNLNGMDVKMQNLHQVTNIPQFNEFLIKKLYDNNVNFDVLNPPQNFLTQIPFTFQVIIGYFVLSGILNFIRTRNIGNGMNIPGNPFNMLMRFYIYWHIYLVISW